MRNQIYRYSLAFLTSLTLVACSKVPDGILKEKDMQAVMTDVYVAEAMIASDYTTYRDDATKEALYQSVFRKHSITQAEYDSSLIWYGKNLKVYMEVYDRVLANIDKQREKLGDETKNPIQASVRDSLNIWPLHKFTLLEPSLPSNLLTYDVKPEVAYSSGSTFVLGVKVWGMKNSLKHKPEVRLSVVQGDTIMNVYRTLETDGYQQIVLRSSPTRQVQHIFGYIRMLNADSTYYRVYLDSISLMKYNYGTPVTVR